jgi:lipopolysaccharide/colanic/teichoic acid biosynthesis glycosyltransferase
MPEISKKAPRAIGNSEIELASTQIRSGLPRSMDIFLSFAGLIVTAPLIALAAICIWLESGGPVLFRQCRIGQGGKTFKLYKLRTMKVNSSGPGVTSADDKRITKLGRLLRKCKIDELPELWNVIKGDLSLVGPRPEVPQYVNIESPEWKIILLAKPGITDPVTCRLRNEESLIKESGRNPDDFYNQLLQPFKLNGYLEYLHNRTWLADLITLLKSFGVTLFPSMTQEILLADLEIWRQKRQANSADRQGNNQ